MNKLQTNLENCYGIKKLTHEFDFSSGKTIVVYAPNGVMKTSFARTFKDISSGSEPKDRIYPENNTIFEIVDDVTTLQVLPEEISVIEPYSEQAFNSEDRILTLLAKQELRDKYQAIYSELDANKKSFITKLKKASGSSDCEQEVESTFVDLGKENFFEILKEILASIEGQKESYEFKYNDVFPKNGKVRDFVTSNHGLLEDYMTKYDEIISGSDFFKNAEGTNFGTSQARVIIDATKDDAFFAAGHKLDIENKGQITSSAELGELVDAEISKVVDTPELKDMFIKIDTALQKNRDLTNFKRVIGEDNTIAAKILDYDSFRKEVWFGYLHLLEGDVKSLLELFEQKKKKLQSISDEAQGTRTIWDKAVEEFNERFIDLPFTLGISNKKDAILNHTNPAIDFLFDDRPIERKELLDVLSQGERRAFYLLNVIFEIKSRELQDGKTIFVIDDIADSFDYKNKYAIVEYLKDISKQDNFYQIILTHNFDFYRLISSRLLNNCRSQKLHAIKTADEIKIIQEVYQNSPFKTWKENMKASRIYSSIDAKKHILALIPFVRNLIEYGHEKNACTYGITDLNLLTRLLHIKEETKNITFRSLHEIYAQYLGTNDFDASIGLDDKIYDALVAMVDEIESNEFNLENKIILAMIIRLKAEEFMWSRVANQEPFTGSSTGMLFGRFKTEFQGSSEENDARIKVLESVNIMTPENIHINSFMYEPILDMGIDELKNLYTRINEIV